VSGEIPMIAGLSANRLAALDLSPALSRLHVARNNDAAGRKAANRLREQSSGFEVCGLGLALTYAASSHSPSS
jgi:Toprim domain